ncbi:MAG TPA: hypothetical protein VN345_20155 [Blastocatellia bacterium]|nr:hypothetical protein [Blastocatellia bacterium]
MIRQTLAGGQTKYKAPAMSISFSLSKPEKNHAGVNRPDLLQRERAAA